ncbi:MAG: hypothetical protein AB7Q42_23955 [Acidimicrobiia bacterium]
MIGFIGPADAVGLATEVALSMGFGPVVTPRVYASAEESAALAAELDRFCDVILFAGRVPHRLSLAGGSSYTASLRYVPESAVDMYHTVASLIRAGSGVMPRISLDTVDTKLVQEVFNEIDLEPPTALLPIDEIPGDWSDIASRLFEFHLRMFESKHVDLCVTWLRSVHDDLRARGVPVWRARHTMSTYREAFTRASLSVEAHRSKSSQIVVGRMLPGRRDDGADRVVACAKELRGTVTPSADGDGWVIYSTRGALDGALTRLRSGAASPFVVSGTMAVVMGFGVGTNMAEALTYAERAAQMAADTTQLCIMHSSGLMYSLDDIGTERVIALRDLSGEGGAPSIGGLGPVSTFRLLDSIRLLDASAVTAPQLADAYGVTVRSARRLLGHLERTGIASRLGREGAPGPGRPKVLYRIDVDRLAAEVKTVALDDA